MVFIIGGHIRSGTTLVRNLCHAHPDIAVTMELGSFRALGKPYGVYSRQLLKRVLRRYNQSFLVQGELENRLWHVLPSYVFVARYLLALRKHQHGRVSAADVESAFRYLFPQARVVGDKVAYYVFLLDELAHAEGLMRVIIYRDCRDVASSALQRVHMRWRSKSFVKNWDTAEKIARHWVHAIELMERHADKLYILRYEDLIQEPGRELAALGEYLGVDPAGYPLTMIQGDSIGKYAHGLSDEELATVINIAGPTMTRLGYL
jgi:hypothetical protein